MIDPSARVHASADLEDDVAIGARTSVWHRAQLRNRVRIGADSVIGRDVFIDEDVALGDRVKVQNGALLYHGLVVGDSVFIGPGAVLTNDRYPRAVTSDGDPARAGDWEVGAITLDEGCSIGANAIVVAGTRIGAWATVGAGAIVTRDVPSHALVVGSPARRIGWVCACGQRLQTSGGDPVPAVPDRYAANLEFICGACGRRYDYAADGERVTERAVAEPSPEPAARSPELAR